MNKMGLASKLTINVNSDKLEKLGVIEVKRNGDKIEIIDKLGINIQKHAAKISEMISEIKEKAILENMTDEEFKQCKDMVDSEWMRRKFNGNSN